MIFDVELHCDKWKNCNTKWCNNDGGFWCKEECKLLQVRPITMKDGLYTRHEVACIIADLLGGTCACDYSGNDEWLPYYCEFADNVCPNVEGVACWEQYLTHKDKREERDD